MHRFKKKTKIFRTFNEYFNKQIQTKKYQLKNARDMVIPIFQFIFILNLA